MPRNRKRQTGRQDAAAGARCDHQNYPDGNGASSDFALSHVTRGCRCRIRRHRARGAVRQRLLDMGFIPNAEVQVLRVATLGDPIEVKVGDSFITLRKHEADQIDISDS